MENKSVPILLLQGQRPVVALLSGAQYRKDPALRAGLGGQRLRANGKTQTKTPRQEARTKARHPGRPPLKQRSHGFWHTSRKGFFYRLVRPEEEPNIELKHAL